MIQKQKTGKFRVRYHFGHNTYYSLLNREKIRIVKEQKGQSEEKRKLLVSQLIQINLKIEELERKFGKPVNIQTRRSFNCTNRWQAELIEKLFVDAYKHEARGEQIPPYLEKELKRLKDAPYRLDYLEEIAYMFASFSGFNPSVIHNLDYELFLKQSDIDLDWLEQFSITPKEVRKIALTTCFDNETVQLKGKTYIFTGAFVSYTVCEDYVNCLLKLAEANKVDGIIVAGPWIKEIFLHKTSETQRVLNSVRNLASKVKIYAIRSNRDVPELIPLLKEIGVNFVSKIEDENNIFLGHQFSKISQKDQLHRYRDFSVDKNIFVYSSYVAFEPQLRNNNIRYIVGSGSSSYNIPRARTWSMAYDSARFNSEKFDSIGGHILRFDEEGQVYPTNFYYNSKAKAIFSNGNIYGIKGDPQKGNLHVLISDIHGGTVDKKAFSGVLYFIEKHSDRIKSICINGDFFDNSLLCHHNTNKIDLQIEAKEKHTSFLHEVATARLLLTSIVEKLGINRNKVKLIFKLGNHDINSINKITNMPVLHFLNTFLDIKNLLGLSELGFEVIDSKKPFFIGDIPIFHGHELTRTKASQILGKVSVMGHLHRGRIDNYGTILPTLQDQKQVEYLRYYKTDWTKGWATITEYSGVFEKPELIIMQNDKFYDFDKLVKITRSFKIKTPKDIQFSYKLS